MKLFLFVLFATILYVWRMKYLFAERKMYSKDELRVFQSIPTICVTTFFYGVVVIQTVRLSFQGFLPLL